MTVYLERGYNHKEELEKLIPTLHMASVYGLLAEFPGASAVASAHLTRLTNLLFENSKD